MKEQEKEAKQKVLKAVIRTMSNINAKKFDKKKEEEPEIKLDDEGKDSEVSLEMLKKLKSLHADKEKKKEESKEE